MRTDSQLHLSASRHVLPLSAKLMKYYIMLALEIAMIMVISWMEI